MAAFTPTEIIIGAVLLAAVLYVQIKQFQVGREERRVRRAAGDLAAETRGSW